MNEANTVSLNMESKAINILKDIDFLRLFKYYIKNFGEDFRIDENITLLSDDFSGNDFLEKIKNKKNKDLYLQFYKFFSDDLKKSTFLDTINEFNLDEKKLNLFLNIGEYLINIGDNKKEINDLSDGLKKTVGSIISGKIQKISYTDEQIGVYDLLQVDNTQKEEEFKFLHTKWGESFIMNEDLKNITILDLLNFLHRNNPSNVKTLINRNTRKLGNINVSNIFKLYNFYGEKFIELEYTINNRNEHVILRSNGQELTDEIKGKVTYIKSLGKIKSFLNMDFVEFSLTDDNKVDGFIDALGHVVKIRGKKLRSIKCVTKFNGEEIYVINNESDKLTMDDLILKRSKLEDELGKYDPF